MGVQIDSEERPVRSDEGLRNHDLLFDENAPASGVHRIVRDVDRSVEALRMEGDEAPRFWRTEGDPIHLGLQVTPFRGGGCVCHPHPPPPVRRAMVVVPFVEVADVYGPAPSRDFEEAVRAESVDTVPG